MPTIKTKISQGSVATLLMWSNCHTVLWQICSR